MNEKGADNVIESTERPFSLSVLRRSVRTRETKKDTVLEKEIVIFEVVKLTAIVTLYKSNGEKKMDGDISLKIEKNSVDVGLIAERKGPNKMCIVV